MSTYYFANGNGYGPVWRPPLNLSTSTRRIFALTKNDCGDYVYTCRVCGDKFIEHDGVDMVTERELTDHILEEAHE